MLTNIINHEEQNMTLTLKVKGQGHSRPTIGFRTKGIMNHASHTRGLYLDKVSIKGIPS